MNPGACRFSITIVSIGMVNFSVSAAAAPIPIAIIIDEMTMRTIALFVMNLMRLMVAPRVAQLSAVARAPLLHVDHDL
jgi:hypothetical protein